MISALLSTLDFLDKNYNPKTNMDSLITIPISKVLPIQRKGLSGRTQPEKFLRLYS
jgi:HrpA-like RNA helicase